jgi:cytochrome P450
MHAGGQLRVWPRYMRPIVHWFLPECQRMRATQEEAVRIIAPVIEARKKAKRDALAAGEPVPIFNDALDWSSDEAKVQHLSYDPAIVQLSLAIAAIHTTADLLEQFILDIAQNPQYFAPLREETVRCLRAGGWKKSSLYNMKLLDSAIKESQRLKPSSIGKTPSLFISRALAVLRGTRNFGFKANTSFCSAQPPCAAGSSAI